MAQDAAKQNIGVILAILGAGIVIAAVAVALFYGLKGNQKIVTTGAETTIYMENAESGNEAEK